MNVLLNSASENEYFLPDFMPAHLPLTLLSAFSFPRFFHGFFNESVVAYLSQRTFDQAAKRQFGEQYAEAGAVLKRAEVTQDHAYKSGERAVDKSCQRGLRACTGSVTKKMQEKSRLPAQSSVSRDTGLENEPRGKITASREHTVRKPRTFMSLLGFPTASQGAGAEQRY